MTVLREGRSDPQEAPRRLRQQGALVYKDFPLPTHPNAQKAAEAARCAGDQGKYWEMHDLMFADISALSVPQLKQGATKLGLNQAAFDQCLDSGKHQAIVQADYAGAEKLGVNSTPRSTSTAGR